MENQDLSISEFIGPERRGSNLHKFVQRDINLGNSVLLTLSAGAEDCCWLKSTLIYSAQHPIKTATYVIPIILHSFFPLSCGVSTPTPYSPVLGEMAVPKSCNYIDLTMQRTLCCRHIFLTRTVDLNLTHVKPHYLNFSQNIMLLVV